MPPLARKFALALLGLLGIACVATWERMDGMGKVLLMLALVAGCLAWVAYKRR